MILESDVTYCNTKSSLMRPGAWVLSMFVFLDTTRSASWSMEMLVCSPRPCEPLLPHVEKASNQGHRRNAEMASRRRMPRCSRGASS